MVKSPETPPDAYPLVSLDKLRYCDTDRQGHVNNAVFASLFETGRVDLLYHPDRPLCDPGTSFVIARLAIDFIAELTWPGSVEIRTRIAALGRSSIRLDQALFQNGRLVARGESIVVLTSLETRRSHPLSEATIRALTAFMAPLSDHAGA